MRERDHTDEAGEPIAPVPPTPYARFRSGLGLFLLGWVGGILVSLASSTLLAHRPESTPENLADIPWQWMVLDLLGLLLDVMYLVAYLRMTEKPGPHEPHHPLADRLGLIRTLAVTWFVLTIIGGGLSYLVLVNPTQAGNQSPVGLMTDLVHFVRKMPWPILLTILLLGLRNLSRRRSRPRLANWSLACSIPLIPLGVVAASLHHVKWILHKWEIVSRQTMMTTSGVLAVANIIPWMICFILLIIHYREVSRMTRELPLDHLTFS